MSMLTKTVISTIRKGSIYGHQYSNISSKNCLSCNTASRRSVSKSPDLTNCKNRCNVENRGSHTTDSNVVNRRLLTDNNSNTGFLCNSLSGFRFIDQGKSTHSFCSHRNYCTSSPSDDLSGNQGDNEGGRNAELGAISPQMGIVYTCKVCQTRSAKLFSKLSYEKGIVIVKCPGCESKHLIADNLGWFDHVENRNIEDILKARGESVKRLVAEDGTTELTLTDVIGKDKLEKMLDQSQSETKE